MEHPNRMKHNPYWDLIGMKEVVLNNGEAVLELPIKYDITQSHGTVHGGVVASLVDACVGAALRSMLPEGERVVTIELKLNYLNAAVGNKLIATGNVVKKGRSIAVG